VRIPTRFVRETDIDCVLLAGRWTLLDRSGGEDLLPACVDRGGVGRPWAVSTTAGCSPTLDRARPTTTHPRRSSSSTRARRLDEVCTAHGVPLKAAALQFPLRHPAVVSVLMGARSTTELTENLALLEVDVPDASGTTSSSR
jgi:D-threo-aldose 1-dehydrogenase